MGKRLDGARQSCCGAGDIDWTGQKMLRGGRKIRKLQECSKVQQGAGRSKKEQEGAGEQEGEEGAGRSRKEQEKCRKVQESAGGRVSWGG
ncbi:hypothetical protein CLOM_g20197 [Closterium sp. NIES-68]|nr:hypothetical protein CLOM_g17594 [Closterium sp. NIES-68]GJP35680.1 hypothetical protein CLOM_g20197 [Closterium sp. NIES-68]